MWKDDQAERVGTDKNRLREETQQACLFRFFPPFCALFFPPGDGMGSFLQWTGSCDLLLNKESQISSQWLAPRQKGDQINIFSLYGLLWQRVFFVCLFLWPALGKRNPHFYYLPVARKRSKRQKGGSERNFVLFFFSPKAFTWGIIFPSPRRPKTVAKSSQNQHRWG